MKHLALVLAGLALLMQIAPDLARTESGGCNRTIAQTGVCPGASATVVDGGVDLSADQEVVTPGRQGTGGGGGNNSGDGDDWDGLPEGVSPVPGGVPVDRGDASPGPGGLPRRTPTVLPADPAIPACQPQTPCDPDLVVRVSDLVNIQAAAPSQGMEPDGWLVVGVPTNFFATASAHVRAGPLLGVAAEVRFTPVAFRWDYGDGAFRTAVAGGSSWAAQNLPEFSETATSHVFEQTGTLTIGLVVSYSAEYRFPGTDWRTVQGLVLVPASPITAIADRAGTVLVAESCLGNSRGPGC